MDDFCEDKADESQFSRDVEVQYGRHQIVDRIHLRLEGQPDATVDIGEKDRPKNLSEGNQPSDLVDPLDTIALMRWDDDGGFIPDA